MVREKIVAEATQ